MIEFGMFVSKGAMDEAAEAGGKRLIVDEEAVFGGMV